MRICRPATVPFFIFHHLREQLAATARAGHEVTVVSSPFIDNDEGAPLSGIRHIPLPIARTISPWRDLRTLLKLIFLLRAGKYDVVHSTTPKAGLLSAIAARLVGVPIRLHTFTGQAWAERRGPVRWIAKACDWLVVRLNTRCYADSFSQRDYIAAEGIAPRDRIVVLGKGSLAGVDVQRFHRGRRVDGLELRVRLGIPAEALVIGFVGRVTRDKGISELVEAFVSLPEREDVAVHLVVVGPQESKRDPLPQSTLTSLQNHPRIHLVGYVAEPEDYMAVFDLFCLPSYREGFGNVVIEAAAMGIPTVGTRIVGLCDAIVDGVTGLLVPPRDTAALGAALFHLLEDEALRLRLGTAAERRALDFFDAEQVNALLIQEYAHLARTLRRLQ